MTTTLWDLSISHYLPTRSVNAAATNANTLKFSMVRTMYGQSSSGTRLSDYYRNGAVVDPTTYFNNNIDSNNQARHLPIDSQNDLKLSQFRGCGKNHILTINPATKSGSNRKLSAVCEGFSATTYTNKRIYTLNVDSPLLSSTATKQGLDIDGDKLTTNHKLFISVYIGLASGQYRFRIGPNSTECQKNPFS